ncbi:MAG TPA: acyl carrier protein [Chthoniobacteraceae bacterium]|nr:acyl carrier protein [Chthoniobacteraceae bacterium]
MAEDEEEIEDNVLRLIETAPGRSGDEVTYEDSLADLGFDKQSLKELAFAINKDEYFKPLGVGLIPDDVADCETVGEVVELVKKELNNDDMPARRKRPGPGK